MAITLPVSRLINVTVNLSPAGAQVQNLNSLLLMGSTAVIDTVERLRAYASLADVALDFSTTDPEYIAAALYFAQAPRPTLLYIGRWAQTATKGVLKGGALTPTEQLIATWQAITTGSVKIAVDGGAGVDILALNFSGAANMNAVAAIIDTAWAGGTVAWDAVRSRFVFTSITTGATSAVDYFTAAASGTPIAALLKGTAATGASKVQGMVAETALAAVTALAGLSTDWYALQFASTAIVDADITAVAGFIEASDPPRVFFYTSGNVLALDPTSSADIFSVIKALNYSRSWGQYSSSSPYASASAAGRVLTTNFNANNSVITLMFKTEPGVIPENLTTTQANALNAKNANVYAAYNNNTSIIQYGKVASGSYFDEIYGADYLRSRVQTDLFNLLYTSPTKIPQTDAGNQVLATGIERSCDSAVNNGLLAAGTWQSGGFGQLSQNDFLPKGYYVYAPPVANQSQADRAARKSVAFQVAAKLAGAIHSADVLINVNR